MDFIVVSFEPVNIIFYCQSIILMRSLCSSLLAIVLALK